MTPSRHAPSLRTVLHLFPPGRDVGDKRARNFPRPSFVVFGQLEGPLSAPRGLSAGSESESKRERGQGREHRAIKKGSVCARAGCCVCVSVCYEQRGDEESITSWLQSIYESVLSHVQSHFIFM